MWDLVGNPEDWFSHNKSHMSRITRIFQCVFRVLDQVQHKPGCTVTENGKSLEILGLLNEPRREKTGFLHMQKQRRRSASR